MNPFSEVSAKLTRRLNEIFQEEIWQMQEKINEVARGDGLQFIIECPKVAMKFTIKPIKSNVKQESSGEKGRTKKGSKESSAKKVGIKKSRKGKFTKSSANPLD